MKNDNNVSTRRLSLAADKSPTALFDQVRRKGLHLSLSLLLITSIAGCSSEDRSRSLGNPNISANTLAMQVCSSCHGVTGNSVSPNFPNLAGQTQPYIVSQLQSFKRHGRLDPAGFEYMWGISSRLTDEQIKGLADYFSSQSPVQRVSQDLTRFKEGQDIFEKGIETNKIPACSACHGIKGEGNQQFPRLAGQHANYLVKQLMVFQRTDQRPEGSIMKTVAHGLTLENMGNVAAYLEAMPPSQ